MAEVEADPSSILWRRRAFAAEQDLLLVRLAADSDARRGELSMVRYSDLDGRVLSISEAFRTACSAPPRPAGPGV